MTRKESLAELIAKVEAGDRSASLRNTPLKGYGGYYEGCLNGSLDAAKALHEAVLPRHYAQVHMWPIPEMCRVDIGGGHTGRDDNPARAWLLAILRALHSMEAES